MYDLLATTFLTNEEFFTYKDSYIDVITDNLPNI
jgi:inosine-uridine nucleoside N-ribohydrolase